MSTSKSSPQEESMSLEAALIAIGSIEGPTAVENALSIVGLKPGATRQQVRRYGIPPKADYVIKIGRYRREERHNFPPKVYRLKAAYMVLDKLL